MAPSLSYKDAINAMINPAFGYHGSGTYDTSPSPALWGVKATGTTGHAIAISELVSDPTFNPDSGTWTIEVKYVDKNSNEIQLNEHYDVALILSDQPADFLKNNNSTAIFNMTTRARSAISANEQ